MSSFFGNEYSTEQAIRRARRNREFWTMVFCCNGLTYTELQNMDMAEYREAVEARILFNTEWKPQKK
ncbi:hypothetical protein B5F55_00055 [Anaerotruncus colihominis]|nr:hypothetical protein B5F55_00055 [Anaerotruncus colihominis]